MRNVTFSIMSREEWLDPDVPWDHTLNGKGEFYICPPFRGWDQIDDVVIHYPGSDWADLDINNDGIEDIGDTIALLRMGHKGYLRGSRGYAYGYGFKIGTSGDIWEVRGWDYANAANLGDKAHNHVGWNNWSISIQIVVDAAGEANALQVAAVNWLLDEIARRKGGPLNLKWHGVGQSTACCGAGIIGQIQRRVIAFGLSTPPKPDPKPDPIPTPQGALVMKIFQPSDCDAEFMGLADDHGNAPIITWIQTIEQIQSRDEYIANGAEVDHGPRNPADARSGFRNCTLLGPVPVGDTRRQWTAGDFFRVVA